MEPDEFISSPPKQQVAVVLQGLANDNWSLLELFVTTYNPQTNLEMSTELETALSNTDFFNKIQAQAVQRPDCFVALMRLWSRISGFEKYVHTCGGLQALAKAMKTNRSNTDLLENACVALGSLATDEFVRGHVEGTDVISVLVQVLQDFPSNSVLLSRACKSLNNFCFHEEKNKTQFLDCGGYAILMDIFTNPSCNDSCKHYASLLLRTIATADFSIKAPNVVQEIIDLLELTVDDSQIQWHLIWTVTNLTFNKIKVKREFGKKAGIERILASMRKHVQNPLIQKAACICIFQLSVATVNRMAVGRAGGIEDVVSVVLSFPQMEVLEMALECLNRLCSQSINRKKLITSQKIDALVDLLSENRDHRDIVLIILGIFYKMANGADESKSCLKKTKILSFLPTVRALYSQDQAVHEVVTAIICDTHKPGHCSQENSDESDDSESSDDLDIRSLQFSLQSNSITYDDEDEEEDDKNSSAKLLVAQQQMKKELKRLQEELVQEGQNAKAAEKEFYDLEDEVKRRPSTSEHEYLELKTLNKTLKEDKQEISGTIAELCMKQNDQKDKTSQIAKLKNTSLTESHQEAQDQEQKLQSHLSQIKEQERILAEQQEEIRSLQKIEAQIEEASDIFKDAQRMTFHWMSLALKLDFMCKSKKPNVNFDSQTLYEQLLESKTPHHLWPTEISKALEKTKSF